MPAKIIEGKVVAEQIRTELAAETKALKEKHGLTPGLVTILVGENPASMSYVTAKSKTAKELGYHSVQDSKPADMPEADLLALVKKYNEDPAIHGILVQLPLPKHINENKVLYAINPDKDVDCFHPVNVGRLVIGEGVFRPCTPAGIQELIIRSGTETKGAELVVVGRSNIVGKPIANLMLQKAKGANSTVTICHTATRDMAVHTRRADILVVAAGFPNAVKGDMIKPGACVIDVGVNRIGVTASGKAKLCGDVTYEEALQVAGAITPVPGGVGPM
ncbi:MAG: bifunctional 5,10-methylene-tetrahydrofolate dehydrogenase/5,10-methylene-tetrahydrofolate cyclohydrolase, partial [Deltaproteobacteria bacterium]|nr:bifunctional 5,10-methylene-tetrahydrofolate dehydrogenase/5,10-methylene-tetrahydrofolate cyclohydrolase [Deltaproteobacteria bacterium]